MFVSHCALDMRQLQTILVLMTLVNPSFRALEQLPSATTFAGLCRAAAEVEIQKAPEKAEMFVTTSHLYKRHLAKYFCEGSASSSPRADSLIALELGVYHGHTTAVLAAIFKKIISVDIEKEYLEIAAKHCDGHANVVFLHMDLMADDWGLFASNRVNVAIIDANHHYEHVRADAQNALRHLPQLQYLVFDDYNEDGVALAVDELEHADVLVECEAIGHGWNGSLWEFWDWDPASGQQFRRWTNRSEGKICKRGPGAEGTHLRPSFADRRFFLYRQPLTHLCQAGVVRFLPNGTLLTSAWDSGRWTVDSRPGRDVLMVHLPGMLMEPMELFFNFGRTAFYLSRRGSLEADWFGIGDHLVHRPFQFASNLF